MAPMAATKTIKYFTTKLSCIATRIRNIANGRIEKEPEIAREERHVWLDFMLLINPQSQKQSETARETAQLVK